MSSVTLTPSSPPSNPPSPVIPDLTLVIPDLTIVIPDPIGDLSHHLHHKSPNSGPVKSIPNIPLHQSAL